MRSVLSLITLSSWIGAAVSQQHIDSIRHAARFSESFHGAAKVIQAAKDLDDRRHLQDPMEEELSWDEGGDHDALACQADLAVCKAEQEAVSYLMVQMANRCELSLEDGVYKLSTKDMAEDTFWFSDRPFAVAESKSTQDFFDDFDNIFSEESGGKPNGAFTLVHEDSAEFAGPIVAMMVTAAYSEADEETGEVTYTYELEQSPSQEAVNAISTFFTDEGGDPSPETFQDCSIFIDNVFSADVVVCTCLADGDIKCAADEWMAVRYNYKCNAGACTAGKSVTGKPATQADKDFTIGCSEWYTACTSWSFDSDAERNLAGTLLGCEGGMT